MDYLHVQADNPWYNYYVFIIADCAANACGMDCSKPCWCNNTITGDAKVTGICPFGCTDRVLKVSTGCETGKLFCIFVCFILGHVFAVSSY